MFCLEQLHLVVHISIDLHHQYFVIRQSILVFSVEEPPSRIGVRHLIIVLLFLCMLCAYILRVNMSVAIVAMMGDTADSTSQTVSTTHQAL